MILIRDKVVARDKSDHVPPNPLPAYPWTATLDSTLGQYLGGLLYDTCNSVATPPVRSDVGCNVDKPPMGSWLGEMTGTWYDAICPHVRRSPVVRVVPFATITLTN